MGIRIIEKNKEKPFRLYLPGILIYFFILFCLVLLIIPILFVLIGLFIWNLVPGQGEMARAYTKIFFSIPPIFWAMRGLTVDVDTEDTIVKIKF